MAEEILKISRFISRFSNITERFIRLLNRFLSVLTFSPSEAMAHKKVVTLSIERGSVNVAYGSSIFSRIKVKALRSFNYDDDRFPTPEELAVAATMVSDQFKKNFEVYLIIPKSWAILKVVEFPIAVKENLPDVLSYEMDRLTPFNPEEVFYDWRPIKEEDSRLFLLVAAAKKDIIMPYIETLREKGIDVKGITISLSAMASLSFYSWRKSNTLFIDIGKSYYEAALFEGPVTIDHTSGNLKTEGEKIDKVLREIQPLFEKAKSSGSFPEVVLLLRDSSIKEALKTRINYPLRILGETDIGITLPSTKDIPFVALGGLIESLSKMGGFNILSYGKRQKEKIPFLFTIILFVSIIFFAVIYLITPLRIEERRLHAIEEQIGQKKVEVKKVESLKKEVEDLKNEVASIENFKKGRSTLAALKEMTVTLPKNTWLTRFRITETNVDIEGYADSATGLLPKLEASRYFRKAEFSSSTFRDARMRADRFIIKMEIETTKQAEVKVEKK